MDGSYMTPTQKFWVIAARDLPAPIAFVDYQVWEHAETQDLFFLHISYNIKIALNRSRFIFLVAGQWRPSVQYNYMF